MIMLAPIEKQIFNNAAAYPDKIALICGNKEVSYKLLCNSVLAARNYFRLINISKGDTIALAADKNLGFVYAYFAAHLAGIQVVLLDSKINQQRFDYIISRVQPKILIGLEGCVSDILKISLENFNEIVPIDEVENVTEEMEIDAIADILFTTGTVGEPKGVPLTNRNIAAAVRNINGYIGNNFHDIELLALPLNHSFGLGRIRCTLAKGATLILLGSFVNIKRIFSIMDKYKVTGFSMVPASWEYMKKFSGMKLGDFAGKLRYIEMGSAYFSIDSKKELASLLPNTRICMHYGLTEASRSAFMEFHVDNKELASVGKASPNTEIKIFDETGLELPDGEEGEIGIKGEHVMERYIDSSHDESYWNGYFRTGDWGALSADGYLYLKSRKKELINIGGKKVSPIEIEEILLGIKDIKECACIGVPDPNGILGEVVKTFIVKAENTDLSFEEIKEYLSGRLEVYKRPVFYEWISELPKTQNGKIKRIALK